MKIFLSPTDHDGAEPSPNSIAALNLLRLGHYFNETSLHDRLRLLFQSYTGQLNKLPMTMPSMIRCLDLYQQGMTELIIQSSKPDEMQQIKEYVQRAFFPNLIIIPLNPSTNRKLVEKNSMLKSFVNEQADGKTRIYRCRNFQCQLPLTSLEELKSKLDPLIFTYQ